MNSNIKSINDSQGVQYLVKKLKYLMFQSVILIIIIFFAGGCGKKQINLEDTLDYLKNLDSYSTDVEMEILNDKQNINYIGKQIYSKDKGYRFEINNERVLLYIGDKIYVKDNISKTNYELDKNFDELYKVTFIGEYINLLYTDEDIKSSLKDIDGVKYQIIHLIIPGINRNMHKAELYISLVTLKPEKLIIYDNKNKTTVRVSYKNFIPNQDIDDSMFIKDGMGLLK